MSYEGWIDGTPPYNWPRLLSMDVGGATANNLEWVAQDPESLSLIAYDEVNKVTTDMRDIATLALPKMKIPGTETDYAFIAKVGDYENRIALDDMGRYGIRFTNAVKQNKVVSVHRLAGYLHPNPKRPYPAWHPMAGQLGAPLFYMTPACKHLISEIPLQKWKNAGEGDSVKDELDRSIKHDAVDCILYIARIMPAPATIPIPKVIIATDTRSLQSKMYWAAVAARKAEKASGERHKPYSPNHGGNDGWKSLLGF